MNLNKAMLIGNLTRDPEVRTTPTGQTVCSFGLATNRRWTDKSGQRQEQAEFHNIVAWGKLAEICGQYLVKGKQVYIEGRLQTRKWQGADGVDKQRTEIVADTMQMLGRASDSPAARSAPPRAAESAAEMPVSAPEPDLEEGIKVEEIPF